MTAVVTNGRDYSRNVNPQIIDSVPGIDREESDDDA
jgi:hypothetical protein